MNLDLDELRLIRTTLNFSVWMAERQIKPGSQQEVGGFAWYALKLVLEDVCTLLTRVEQAITDEQEELGNG